MLQKSKLTHRNSNATNCDESLSPDLITCTDIIFITVHMNTGCYLRRLLIQCEQNIACFMVESFGTKRTNQNNFFGVLICVYQFYQLFGFVVDIFVLYFFKVFLFDFCIISPLSPSENCERLIECIVCWTWYWTNVVSAWRFCNDVIQSGQCTIAHLNQGKTKHFQ